MKRYVLSLALFLASVGLAVADFVTTSNPTHPTGTRAQIDAPGELHIKNIGGSDGAGLCVGTSNEVAGRWQSLAELDGLQKWLSKRPGGSYPEMLERDLKLFATSKGVTVPSHIQHTGGDIEFLRLAVKTRRMVGITYAGMDTFYGANSVIAHMVDCAHLDGKLGAIIDNNQPGSWRWMSDEQLINRWLGKTDAGRNTRVGGGWAVVWLTSPPPPIDTKAAEYLPERPIVTEPRTWDEEEREAREQGRDGPTVVKVGDLDEPQEILYPNGYDPDMLKPRMRYWIDGDEVSRPQAFEHLKRVANDFSDDSGRAFVSVVSDEPGVAAKLKAALAPYAGKLHIGVFRTDSWVAKQRLKAKVTGQLPISESGKTVFKADTLDEATYVRAAKAALGIVDPLPVTPKPDDPPFTPKPSPDDKPAPVSPPDTTPVRAPLKVRVEWIIAGIFGVYMLTRKRT